MTNPKDQMPPLPMTWQERAAKLAPAQRQDERPFMRDEITDLRAHAAALAERVRELEAAVERWRNLSNMQRETIDIVRENRTALALAAQQQVEAERARYKQWYDAVTDACIVSGELPWDENDARGSLAKLIAWREEIALDPRVSERAAALAARQPVNVEGEQAMPYSEKQLAAMDEAREISKAVDDELRAKDRQPVEAEPVLYVLTDPQGSFVAGSDGALFISTERGCGYQSDYERGCVDAPLYLAAQQPATVGAVTDEPCTEPNRAACPRLCIDFCNKEEKARVLLSQQGGGKSGGAV